MKKKWILEITVFLILFVFSLSWAETGQEKKEFEVYNLGEVVVSAENPKVKEIAIVTEVTAEDIKATNSHTVAEALLSAPGIRVTTGAKNTPSVSIHGFAQNRILVLIDGVPYYETKYGSLDLNQIPTENIAKIEITQGAASVLYGANALGGVINIITKKPSEKPYTSVSMEFSENNTQRYSATHGMKTGIFNYWLNYTYGKSDGYNLSGDFQPKATTIIRKPGGTSTAVVQGTGKRVNSDYENNDLWAKVGLEPQKDSEYYLNFHYLDRDKAWSPSTDTMTIFTTRPYFSQFARLPNYTDWGLDLDAKQKVHDTVTLKAKLFYHNHTDDLVSYLDQTYAYPVATSTYKDYILGGSFFTDFQPAQWDILRFSLHYKKDNHQQRDDTYLPFAQSESYTGSLGIENEFNLVKNFSVVAGISYDWFNVAEADKTNLKSNGDFLSMSQNPTPSASQVNPMMGLTYTFSDATKLFGSLAHKSRFPTLDELYSSKGGNPNLKSETSWNYTLGVSRPFSTYAKAGLALFYYDISDLITRDAPPPISTYVNYGSVQMAGFEVDGEVYPLDGLTLRADYTYEDARNRSAGRVSDNVTYVPVHKMDIEIQYLIPQVKTRINCNMIYVGESFSQLPTPSNPTQATLKMGDYTILKAKVSQPFLKYFEAYVAVNNILDTNYAPEFGYPAPGRSFWLGLSAKF
jgi:iron complex outermembrane recepter protein